ncbi:MAG: hypothetical protein JXR37_31525 [Kiritimatiellae bacterium]|nr:hypothetical protein [Kiritimatiellia bacterium]
MALTGDPDGDGMSDLGEWIAGSDPRAVAPLKAGTNPLDPESRFQVSGFRFQGDACEVSFDSVTGRVYGMLWNTDLMDTNG